MGSPEADYIRRIDRELHPPPEVSREAEEVVIEFFRQVFGDENVEVRPATKREDEGYMGAHTGKRIDSVAYWDGKPAWVWDTTTARSRGAREEKFAEMRRKPFVRLDEMKPQDPAVPKAIIVADREEVAAAIKEGAVDFTKHKRLASQILESTISSFKFDLSQTRNSEEIKRLNALIALFERKMKSFEAN